MKNKILIIDSLNQFFRSYIVDPSLSTNGQPIGGIKGYLKILQKLIGEIKPTHIVICWDGANGSKKRKTIVKDYKEGRKPLRLNRDIRNLTANEEIQNKVWQQIRLMEYLNFMPIIQVVIDEVEADDVIAYVARQSAFRDDPKIIISSDKDFFQLCDDTTILYRPIQKEVLNENSIVEKYDIHPNNFALARAIAGDTSDNLSGVGGVGLKTIAKRIPFFSEDRSCTIQEVHDYCASMESDLKVYNNIVKHIDKVGVNYDMMQLYSPSISFKGKRRINYSIDECEYEFNRTEVLKMMLYDGFGEGNWETLFRELNRISTDNRKIIN